MVTSQRASLGRNVLLISQTGSLLLAGLGGHDLGSLLATEATSAASGNETNLLTGGAVAAHGRGVTDMLMVTTTVGMVNGLQEGKGKRVDRQEQQCPEQPNA